jgi:hypothetical protein
MIRRLFKVLAVIVLSIYTPYITGRFLLPKVTGFKAGPPIIDWVGGFGLIGISALVIMGTLIAAISLIDYIKGE